MLGVLWAVPAAVLGGGVPCGGKHIIIIIIIINYLSLSIHYPGGTLLQKSFKIRSWVTQPSDAIFFIIFFFLNG